MRKIAITIFFVLLAGISSLLIWKFWNRPIFNASENPPPANNTAFPVEPGATNVGQVFLHYFFEGSLKSVYKSATSSELVLENPDLPKILVDQAVRISKIKPPYQHTAPILAGQKDLKVGVYVIISAEYDLNSKSWIIRDVFIPIDKN